jgi:hypothetical protein
VEVHDRRHGHDRRPEQAVALGSQDRREHDITDRVSRHSTSFGGKIPAGTAADATAFAGDRLGVRLCHGGEGDGEGARSARRGDDRRPTCTRLKFVSEQYGVPEYCVAKNGVVLKWSNVSSTAEMTYEAISIDDKAPDADRFVTPKDLKVEEKASGPKKNLKLF